jgi:hypothetical protein
MYPFEVVALPKPGPRFWPINWQYKGGSTRNNDIQVIPKLFD